MRVPDFITKRMSSINLDPEKGPVKSQEDAAQSRTLASPMPTLPRNDHTQAMLTEFRNYIGISNDPDFETNRPIANLGIYQRLVKLEKQYKQQFQIFSWLINSALGLQIIFAAALTALGAGDGPRSAVTAFGALNTIIAGFLTYLKGSGLPNRLKYYKEEITKVREYIEQREREMTRGNGNIDLATELRMIEEMYEGVKRDIEVNNPEAYVSRTKESGAIPSVEKYASHARREFDTRMYDTEDKIGSLRRGVESRFRDTRSGMEDRFSQARSGMEDRFSQTRYGLEDRANQARYDLDDRVGQTRHGLEDRANQARYDLDERVGQARHGIEDRANQARYDLDDKVGQARFGLESRYSQERLGFNRRVTDARQGIESEYQQTRSGVERDIDSARVATASQIENTRHGLETRIEDTRAGLTTQVEETRHGMESRLKEVQAQVKEQEDKIMGIAESVASKVLAVTQKRHEHEQK